MRMRIIKRVTSCPLCFGMGVMERGNGDTYECPKCHGKGVL